MPRKIEYYVCTKCDATFNSEADAIEHENNCLFGESKELIAYELFVEVQQTGLTYDVSIEEAARILDAKAGRGRCYVIEDYDEYGDLFDRDVVLGRMYVDIDIYDPAIITVTRYQLHEDPTPWAEMKKEALHRVELIITELNAVKNKLKEEVNA